MYKKVVYIVLVLIAALAVNGCTGDTKKPAATAEKSPVTAEKNSITPAKEVDTPAKSLQPPERSTGQGQVLTGVQLGQRAPDFSLSTGNDETITLGNLRGSIVVVNFFATWCGPCREEMRDLELFYRAKAEDVVFLGINIKESKDTVMQFVTSGGYTFPMLLDFSAQTAEKYRVRAIPTTLIIDKQGIVQHKKVGPITARQLNQMVDTARK